MKSLHRCGIGLLAFQMGLASLCARQILLQPQGRGATIVNNISNLRVGRQSADGTELELTMEVTYDGLRGPTVRIVPIISDRKKAEVSHWFGAETKVVGQGKGTISLKVKFFNDEPGVPPELTTDRIRLIMLSDSGNSVVSESPVLKTIKWGNPNIKPVPLERSAPVAADEAKAAQLAAQNKQAAQRAQAEAEKRAKDLERLQAQAEQKARDAAQLKEQAERLRVDAENRRIAEEKRQAEIQRQADEKAKAEDAQRQAEIKRQAEEQAKAEDAQRQADIQRLAEEKAKADLEEKRLADVKAKADADLARAQEEAAAQAREAERLKVEVAAEKAAEAKHLAEERTRAEAAARIAGITPSTSSRSAAFVLSKTARTKVSNVDVVNRSLDRSEMTIEVKYDYKAEDGLGLMGVDVASADDAAASTYFTSPAATVGKSSRSFLLFPVKFNPSSEAIPKSGSFGTNKVWVYLAGPNGEKTYISSATMLLVWHPPRAAAAAAPAAAAPAVSGSTARIGDVTQNNAFSGSAVVHYNLGVDSGRIHARLYDSANPESAGWFDSEDVPIKSGPGISLVNFRVRALSPGPAIFSADTIEITLLDEQNKVLATVQTKSDLSWAKPK